MELIKKRKIDEYLVQLRIITNPHLKQEDAKKLIDELRAAKGIEAYIKDSELDEAAFNALKDRLQKGSKAIRVK